MEMAGLDWSVSKIDLYYNYQSTDLRVDDRQAVIRNDNGNCLGIVSRKKYTPINNKDAFSFMDVLAEGDHIRYSGAGTFRDSRVIWMQAEVVGTPIDIGKRDVINKYVLAASSHDGSLPMMGMFTPIRVACQNTLNAAVASAKGTPNFFKIRHIESAKDKIKEAQKMMEITLNYYKRLEEKFKKMALQRISKEDLVKYANSVVDCKFPLSKKISHMRDRLVELAYSSPGSEKFPGSIWNAYNGVVYYVDYEKTVKHLDTDPTNRGASVLFGSGMKLKERAYKEAVRWLN